MNETNQPSRRNLRLIAALAERKATQGALANAAGCNVKTVARWVNRGDYPRPEHLLAAASFLRTDPNWLWPRRRTQINPELINLYTEIGEVSAAIWRQSARSAQHSIDIATHTAPLLPHDVVDILRDRSAGGVHIRICAGIATAATADVDLSWLRIATTPPAIGIYRFDDEMLVRLGQGSEYGHSSPVLHLRWCEDGGVFDTYRGAFSRLWRSGEAIANHGSDWFRTRAAL